MNRAVIVLLLLIANAIVAGRDITLRCPTDAAKAVDIASLQTQPRASGDAARRPYQLKGVRL